MTHDKLASSTPDQPLGMTVHTMPLLDPRAANAPRTAAGRWKLLAVLFMCAAPVLASYFMYYVVRPEARQNYGELVNPQRPLPALATQTLDGVPGTLPALKGQWLLVTVAGGACAADCETNLYFQRQLRESLGREKDRIDRVWLIPDAVPVAPALLPALASATVLRVDAQGLTDWLQPAAGAALADHLYVVDPQGNWMMRFPAHMDAASAAKAKRDLDRLLRASSGWDQGGRVGSLAASGAPAQ